MEPVMSARQVRKTVTGNPAIDGAGVHLVRVLGYSTTRDFDPFLMLDAFDSTNPDDYIAGFPMHPHRGIETVTYLVKGIIEHKDSLGNVGTISDGACQWMTAGSGILHQEMPQPTERILGLQLWVNLPTRQKMTVPKYNNLEPDMIPLIHEEGVEVRIVSGKYKEQQGAMAPEYVDVTYLDVNMQPNQTWNIATKSDDTVFAYILLGSLKGEKNGELLENRRAVLFGEGDEINFTAGSEGARFVLVSGAPLNQPISWGGPIVMSSEEDLRTAYFELENNTFIKHKI